MQDFVDESGGNARKRLEEFFQSGAFIQMIEKRRDGHPRTGKTPYTTHFLRIPVDSFAQCPVHVFNITLTCGRRRWRVNVFQDSRRAGDDAGQIRQIGRHALVIGMGEFGRTPNIHDRAGRDHHCKAWSAVFAGGGIPGGRILGASDSTTTEVTDFPVEPEDLMHTLYTRFGIDPAHEFQSSIRRPVRVANGGKIIPGLFVLGCLKGANVDPADLTALQKVHHIGDFCSNGPDDWPTVGG